MAVTVYTKPGCVQCTATERALEARNIPFELVNLSVDEAAYAFVQSPGYRQAPVVVACERHWVGYLPAEIDALGDG